MENCLITKLSGVVDNNDLDTIGSIRIHVKPLSAEDGYVDSDSNRLYVGYRNENQDLPRVTVVKGTGGFSFNSSEPKTQTDAVFASITGGCIYFSNDSEFDVLITNLYYIWDLFPKQSLQYGATARTNWFIDTSRMDYAHSTLREMNLNNTQNFGVFNKVVSGLNYFKTQGSVEDISIFKNCTSLKSLQLINSNNSDLSKGNITDLKNCTQLQYLTIASNSQIVGEINDLASQIAANRTSGILNISCIDSKLTDDGNVTTTTYLRSKGGFTIRIAFDPSATGGYTKSYV